MIDQEWVQIHLARLWARAEYLKLINWKVAWAADKGLNPADASATKVYGSEFALEAYRVLLEIVGQAGYLAEGSPGAVLGGHLEQRARGQTIFTFGGGTNEIQRDIIAWVGPRPAVGGALRGRTRPSGARRSSPEPGGRVGAPDLGEAIDRERQHGDDDHLRVVEKSAAGRCGSPARAWSVDAMWLTSERWRPTLTASVRFQDR